MPRESKRAECISCGEKPQICLTLGFYVLGGKLPGKPRQQVKGTLKATKGYCTDCFARALRKLGVGNSDVQTIKRLLGNVRYKKQVVALRGRSREGVRPGNK